MEVWCLPQKFHLHVTKCPYVSSFRPSSSTGASAAPKMAAPLAARKVVVLVAQVVTWWLWGSLASRLQWGRVRSPVDTAELPGISLKRNAFLPKKKLFRNTKTLHVGKVFSCASYNFHFKGSNNVNPFPPMDPKIIKPQPLPTMTGSHQGTYPENSLHPKCLQKNTAEKKSKLENSWFSCASHGLPPGLWVTLASLVHAFFHR